MGDQVDRGVMTGDEYKRAIAYDLAGGHASVRAVVVHQLRDHAVVGVFLERSRQADEVFCSNSLRLASPFSLRRRPSSGGRFRAQVGARHAFRDPGMEKGFVLQRHSHNPADYGDRQRIGVIIDNVDPFFAPCLVEQAVDDAQALRFHARESGPANEAARSAASPGGALGHGRADR